MGAPSLRDAVSYGLDVLASTVDAVTNVVTLVLGDAQSTTGATESTGVEAWYPPGYCAIPAPPTKGSPSAQVLAMKQGDRDVVFATRDVRYASRYANLKPGEACVFATVGAARTLLKADGSITLYTTDDNTDSGKAVWFKLHPTDGFSFNAPWGSFTFDQLGWRVRHAGGFTLRAGGIGGLPGPLSALGSYFNVAAAIQKYQGPMVLLGNGPAYSPVCWAPAENPLTTPGVPLTAIGFGAPTGQFTTASVRVSAS